MSNIICRLGLHLWRYYREEYEFKYKNDKFKRLDGKKLVPLRECKWCKERQHHLMPTSHQFGRKTRYNWRPWGIKQRAIFILK